MTSTSQPSSLCSLLPSAHLRSFPLSLPISLSLLPRLSSLLPLPPPETASAKLSPVRYSAPSSSPPLSGNIPCSCSSLSSPFPVTYGLVAVPFCGGGCVRFGSLLSSILAPFFPFTAHLEPICLVSTPNLPLLRLHGHSVLPHSAILIDDLPQPCFHISFNPAFYLGRPQVYGPCCSSDPPFFNSLGPLPSLSVEGVTSPLSVAPSLS
ncbi:hypothetical protein AMTR_s00180p00018330 [Amborella trichopoda]|uniref:Uncharacterized protein n=1 Tax=Amborella trichopoda TaxID=13333 RepID=W1PY18_AMBTC|nr:hypothetical protein AMTR_s00180p00018330 [Amborella trichopoda]